MPALYPPRADLRVIDPAGPPFIDSWDGDGGGTSWYCRACGEHVGHADSGRFLLGLVAYTDPHVCVMALGAAA